LSNKKEGQPSFLFLPYNASLEAGLAPQPRSGGTGNILPLIAMHEGINPHCMIEDDKQQHSDNKPQHTNCDSIKHFICSVALLSTQ
jgi:hypothetical protein